VDEYPQNKVMNADKDTKTVINDDIIFYEVRWKG
jgi:hypothetical protein